MEKLEYQPREIHFPQIDFSHTKKYIDRAKANGIYEGEQIGLVQHTITRGEITYQADEVVLFRNEERKERKGPLITIAKPNDLEKTNIIHHIPRGSVIAVKL